VANLRILIADDHQLIRRGVRDLLSRNDSWQVVGEACNGSEAVRLAAELLPDVVILDFSMPELTGPEAARQILANTPRTRIIILTMHDSAEVVREVLSSGALALVLKSDADRDLLESVSAVADNRHFFAASVATLLLGEFLDGNIATPPGSKKQLPQLTNREDQVLKLLADGMTSKEAAVQLQISVRTVESHRVNIGRKLGFNSIADLMRYAIRNGIVTLS
jgi:DNA-binding NarL/FixJ family response regulator